MDWTRSIDAYCERLDPALLAEPLNAASNLAFFVAALVVARMRPARQPLPWEQRLQPALIAAIGAGSLAFHTFATAWAALLDVGFIALYIYVWLGSFLARACRWRAWAVGLALLGYLVFGRVLDRAVSASGLDATLSGSDAYLPALLTLSIAAIAAATWAPAQARRLGAAAVVFIVSLTARTLDLPWCAQWPHGTHFIWHLLNAVVLYLASTALWHPGRGRLRRDTGF